MDTTNKRHGLRLKWKAIATATITATLSSCFGSPATIYIPTNYWTAKQMGGSIGCCLDEQMEVYASALLNIFNGKDMHCSPASETPSNVFKLEWTNPYYVNEKIATEKTFFWWDITGFMEESTWTQKPFPAWEPLFYSDDVDPSRWLAFTFWSTSPDYTEMRVYSTPKPEESSINIAESSSRSIKDELAVPNDISSEEELLCIAYRYIT